VTRFVAVKAAKIPTATAFGLVVMVGAFVASCAPAQPKPAAEESAAAPATTPREVNLYSSRHYDADEALYAAFTADTGIAVRRIEAKTDLLSERLAAEGASSPADVVLMTDVGAMQRLADRELLQPFAPEAIPASIPQAYRDPDQKWLGLAIRARVIAVDTKQLTFVPQSYADLVDPRLKGEVCARSSSNAYNLALMAGLIESVGQEAALTWAKGVVANFAREPEGADTDQLRAIAAGVCSVAMVNHYYWVRLARSDVAEDRALTETVSIIFPKADVGGTALNLTAVGLATHAPNKAEAAEFVAYLASPKGQSLLSNGVFEFPASADPAVTPVEQLVGIAGFDVAPIPLAALGRRQSEAQLVFEQAGWR